MTQAVNLITFDKVVVATHDTDDLAKLATFLLALSEANFDTLGVCGGAQIKYHNRDYNCVFDGGVTLCRRSPTDTFLMRRTKCPACLKPTFSDTPRQEYCNAKCWNEISADVA